MAETDGVTDPTITPAAAAAAAADALGPEVGLLAGLESALSPEALSHFGVALAAHPTRVVGPTRRFGLALAEAAYATTARWFGGSRPAPLEPEAGDRRFLDPAWRDHPWFFGLEQGYLAWARYMHELLDAADLEQGEGERARHKLGLVVDGLSPTNFLATNPLALRRAVETKGASVVAGVHNFLDDLATNGGKPRQVDASKFRVGENLACTPGKVVFRNELMELIQYAPTTKTVHTTPLLCSPPWINKYYVMDLAPERSLVEWAVQHGHTVFMISYRDPDASMGSTSFEDYLNFGDAEALDVVTRITGSDKVNLMGLCLGGLMATLLTARCAARDDDRINSLTLLNTMLDYSEVGPVSSFVSPEIVDRLEKQMQQTGYLPAESMATTFDLLRANDLIFNYIGPNWLEGKAPPAFDILAWNADSTRMPAAMHASYLRHFYLENELARGALELDGEPISLKAIHADTFIVAAENDHIAPWRTSFTSTELIGGDVTFVLSTAGHIAGVVNPPSPKAKHWVGTVGATGADAPGPDAWRARSSEVKGSWWETWSGWIGERAGGMRTPPPTGNDEYPVLGDAPGDYVRGTA